MSVSRTPYLLLALCYFSVLGSIKDVMSRPCDDSQCRTGSCDEDGACICDVPDPSTILDGDRLFLGGRHCNEEMTMCDGTNSFWCEHGGKCEEIVQGEVYSCRCPAGYAGEHCEHRGAPCGGIFCFHGAQCLVEDGSCECPHGWRGSVDCSLPTEPSGSSRDSPAALSGQSGYNGMSGMLVFFLVLCSLGVVWGVAVYSKKLCSVKHRMAQKSQQLSQRPPYRMLEEDDDNATEVDSIRNDNSHL